MQKNNKSAGHAPACSCSGENTFSDHKESRSGAWKKYIPSMLSFTLLAAGIIIEHFSNQHFFSGYVRLGWYIAAYIPVGLPVIKEAVRELINKSFFNEFTLMVIATLGAFFIGEYPEAVAVMLFYSVGELFQNAAVDKAKRNIKALLDIRPDTAGVLRGGEYRTVRPEEVRIGETIRVKAGEKVPLDGALQSDSSSFNSAALTGESKPKTIRCGESVLAGMINLDKAAEIRVEKEYADSSLAKILEMVQHAASRKAKTELLIRKFAKIYTPIVFFLASAIAVVPYFIVSSYVFSEWLYRALVFLVISCPCALVISIPLGYFGGIGAASRHGILFKGANYLDLMSKVNILVMDKTGTMTKGVFQVKEAAAVSISKEELVRQAAAVESQSNHPAARALVEYAGGLPQYKAEDVEEIAGRGIKGIVNKKQVLAGNKELMRQYKIDYDKKIDDIVETAVIIAIDGAYAGYIIIADQIKDDAAAAVAELHRQKIKTVMLSGDKTSITKKVAGEIGVDDAYGDLLPQDKAARLEALKADPENVVAFVGDGINDMPVLALSDIGIAMGGIGSDAAIEAADVVIQTDEPSRIPTAIAISKAANRIVVQNIILAFSIKVIVLVLGALGMAAMWGAVFADVGAALLAILNAIRIMKKKF